MSWLKVLLFSNVALLVTSQSPQCSVPGECQGSDVIFEQDSESEIACLRLCQNTEDCAWYTYNVEKTNCLLLKNCGNIDSDHCTSCLSGESTCEAELQCSVQGLCMASLLWSTVFSLILKILSLNRESWIIRKNRFQRSTAGKLAKATTNACGTLSTLLKSCASYGRRVLPLMEIVRIVQAERGTANFPRVKILGILLSINKRTFISTSGKSRILVTGGQETPVSEVFSFDPGSTCEDFASLPSNIERAVGGLLAGGRVFICGGYSPADGYSNKCFVVGEDGEDDSLYTSVMEEVRSDAASLVLNGDTLWVTGGGTQDYQLDTTELVRPGRPTQRGPKIPYQYRGHCLVRLNETTAMLIGGSYAPGGYSGATYLYDIPTETWTDNCALNVGRFLHACGVAIDEADGAKIVVAAGGYAGLAYDNTEIWVEGSNEFVFGPRMPRQMFGAAAVDTPDGDVLVIGGYSDDQPLTSIYRFHCYNRNCQWTKTAQETRYPRHYSVALIADDLITTCSNDRKFWLE